MTEEKLSKEFSEKKKEIQSVVKDPVTTVVGLKEKVPKIASYEVLIEVVNDIEFKTAICQMDGNITQCTVKDDLTKSTNIYFYGKWGKVPVVVVQTGKRVGSQFQYGSWFETKKALYFMPDLQYVFGVGVCGAATNDDGTPRVSLGHIVVSSHIIGYDHQKKKAEHDENRSYFANLEENDFYRFMCHTMNKDEWDTGLHFGQVLSGSWLVADIAAQKVLLNYFQKDEIAFEMEGVGIAAACQHLSSVKCYMVVKGVSDYANRNKNDAWQPAAAKNAACYLSDMINKVCCYM